MNSEQYTYNTLEISKLPDGGFTVGESFQRSSGGMFRGPAFACTDLGEALAYIRKNLEPQSAR